MLKGFHFTFLILLSITGKGKMLTTVDNLDLHRYEGTWYEIARLPNSFEKNLSSVTATYTLKPNGKIQVVNKGFKNKTKWKSIKGVAWVPREEFPGQLKVRFFWPFAGDYYVIALDKNYEIALVGSPSRKFLWVLARQPKIPESTYKEYVAMALEHKFDVSELIRIDQSFYLKD